MSLQDYLPLCGCPSCQGRGTCMVPDAVFVGEFFAVVCSRCGGSGFAPASLPSRLYDAPLSEPSDDEDIPF